MAASLGQRRLLLPCPSCAAEHALAGAAAPTPAATPGDRAPVRQEQVQLALPRGGAIAAASDKATHATQHPTAMEEGMDFE